MSARINSFGTQLQMGDGGGVEVFTAIAGLTNIDGPGLSVGNMDATAHDTPSAAREFVPELIDGGEVSIEGYYDPAEATHKNTAGIIFVTRNRLTRNFKVVDKDTGASTTTFRAFFTEFRRTAPMDGLLGFTATLKITGLPVFP